MPAQDGVIDIEGVPKMADETPTDICDDISMTLLEESGGMHTSLMAESRGNALSAHSIVRHSAARKFNQEDPIEAAAAEMILTKT